MVFTNGSAISIDDAVYFFYYQLRGQNIIVAVVGFKIVDFFVNLGLVFRELSKHPESPF